MFEQHYIDDRCAEATAIYRLLGGKASDYSGLKPPSEARIRRFEQHLKATLPATFRAMLFKSESVIFEWSLPAEVTSRFGELAVVNSGRLRWDLSDLVGCEQLRRAWVKDDFRDRGLKRNHLWQDSLPFHHLGNGEFLAMNLHSTTGEAVVYLHPKFEGLHGVELAQTFHDFIDRVTRLGCPGPDQAQLAPFVDREIGIDVAGASAQKWLSMLEDEAITADAARQKKRWKPYTPMMRDKT